MVFPIRTDTRVGVALLVAVACGLVAACGHPVQKKLEGRWLGDAVENFNDSDVAAATGWAKGASMEFAGSTVTISIPAEEPRSGKYKIVKVHDTNVELAISHDDSKLDKMQVSLDDERSMRWMLGNGRAVVMRRVD